MLDEVSEQGSASCRHFTDPTELAALVEDDLAALLSERFMVPARCGAGTADGAAQPAAGDSLAQEAVGLELLATVGSAALRILTSDRP